MRDIIRMQEPSEMPEPSPTITPEMVRTVLEALESRGIIYYAEGGAYVPTEMGWKLVAKKGPIEEVIIACGHPSIVATGLKSVVITKNNEAENSDVIAIKANKACRDLKKEVKDALMEARKIEITIEAEGMKDKIIAYGSPALKLSNPEEIVIRKDDFIDGRTVAILADKSANELSQDLIEKLRKPYVEVKIILEISP